MKARSFVLLSALVGLCSASRADLILLSDTFTGASLDGTKWTTILPVGGSSVTQSGGKVTTTNRGILATQADFDGPYRIDGTFSLLTSAEHFNVSFRTDLSTPGSPFYEREGMLVSFSNDGDQISIQRYTSPSNVDILALASFALTTGLSYNFSIFDDGTNIVVAVNGVNLLAATSTYSTGDKVAFYSREFGSTAIDSVTIFHVPETGLTALYVSLAMVGLLKLRRLQPV